ncbi:MAG: hypothetical protein KDK70_38045, partial [Myxococcales bacterium]|nr:hypothetical protein [Myxococcales bacterium]
MSHDPRHWSRSPERSGPIRNFMGAAEGGAAAGPSPAQQAVDMGYRVVDAHIQQGRDQARQRTGWPMMDGASPWGGMGGMGGMGDMSWVLRPWMSMAEMWMRMLMAPGAWLGGMSGPMGPAQGRHGSFFDGPSPSYGVTPPDGTHAQPPGWRPLS